MVTLTFNQILNPLLFLVFLLILIKCAEYATRYASKIAKMLKMSEFLVSFFIVAVISALPETTISIISALKGIPEFGMGTLIGSNVADLSLVFGIVSLMSLKGIIVKSKVLKRDFFYIILLSFPILLGFDGNISRMDGLILIVGNILFLYSIYNENKSFDKSLKLKGLSIKNFLFLIASLAGLLVSANYAINYAVAFAKDLGIPSVVISLTAVAIGVCLPELMFSIRAVRKKHGDLALGDILGTVIIDATLVLGIVALISPIYFERTFLMVTGGAMLLAGVLSVIFIRSRSVLTKTEGICLLLFYVGYLVVELMVNGVL